MNNKLEELTRSLAQPVTRRRALRSFGVGIAAAATRVPECARVHRSAQGGVGSEAITTVGYGVELGPNPGHPPTIRDGLRRVAESEFHVLHPRWLFLDQNEVHDLGGTGGGDSGGPAFWTDLATRESTLVAIGCRGTENHSVRYRVDTEEAQSFLDDVIERVEAGEF